MPHEGKCIFCNSTWVSWHHVVHKKRGMPKKFSILDYNLNLVEVCEYHHTGGEGLHTTDTGHERDKQLRIELQQELEKIFFKSYYFQESIKKLLKYKDNQIRGFCKGMMLTVNGYRREDIILRLMNGMYAKKLDAEVA